MINSQLMIDAMNELYENDSEWVELNEQIDGILILCLKKLKQFLREDLLTDEEEEKIKKMIQEIESELEE